MKLCVDNDWLRLQIENDPMENEMNEEIAIRIATEGCDEDDYQYVEDGEDGSVKHDITAYYIIVKQLSDNTFWQISYHSSYNYGFDEHSVIWWRVKPVEKVIISWEAET
jgi:hypothetical protein